MAEQDPYPEVWERVARGLRASRDRRGERDAEVIRDLAVDGLQALAELRERAKKRAEETAAFLERAAYLVDNLVEQVPEFTGVVGPGGEREDDYIAEKLHEEAEGWRSADEVRREMAWPVVLEEEES